MAINLIAVGFYLQIQKSTRYSQTSLKIKIHLQDNANVYTICVFVVN